MLTLQYSRYCFPGAVIDHAFSAQCVLGKPDKVAVVICADGTARLPDGRTLHGSDVLVAGSATVLHAGKPCRVHGVLLGGLAARELARQLAQPLVLPAGRSPDIEEMLTRLAKDSARMTDAGKSALAYALLCRLVPGAPADTVPPLVAAAIAEMREHYAQVYGVEELAHALGVSKSHLIRSFTAAMGASPGRYLTMVRVDAAKRFLLREEYTLDTVASLCGFSGANYLCKVFKSLVGQTPTAWRRKMAPQPLGGADEEREQQLYL